MAQTVSDICKKLILELPGSSGNDRRRLAHEIIDAEVGIEDLSLMLHTESQVVSRFLWLLTDIAWIRPDAVKRALPSLWKEREAINYPYQASFAQYWLVCGVPEQDEAEALDALFSWLRSSTTNSSTKTRSLKVLVTMMDVYPELKNELKLSLEELKETSSISLRKLVDRTKAELR
ncbi:MAG: hypothetical protein JJ975_00375 [Bacteroidia bacterium]|nr:hypothetical protein [Bacteroidia bacterium]